MKAKDWLELVARNPAAFGIENGFSDLGKLHNDWIKSFLFGRGDFTLQAHRGSYKTTCVSIAQALSLVLYPEKTIIFIRKTDTNVMEVVRQVGKLLKSDMLQSLSLALYERPIVFEKETASEIDTNLHVGPKGSSQLLGLGLGASITGKHADLIMTDDIVTLADRQSRSERERTKSAYQELQNIKNSGGRIVNTGTPWHKDDAFVLMPNPEKYDCYMTGLLSDEEIDDRRSKMSPSLFAANYELKHIADEESLLPTAPQFTDDESLIYDGIAHIDASYGGSDGTAFTIAKEREGKIYVYGELHQRHADEVLAKFEAVRQMLRAGTAYLERNSDKGYLAREVAQPVATYNEDMNKFIKISTYLRGRWGDVVFLRGTQKEYIDQVMDYTEFAEHDDAPDSLASAIRVLSAEPWQDASERARKLRLIF